MHTNKTGRPAATGSALRTAQTNNHTLLDRLDKVRRTGSGRYVARCPAHGDRNPSLTIRLLDDGRTLIHCFGGCDVAAVLAAIGMELSDLFPSKPEAFTKNERRPFHAADILRAVAFESTIVLLAANDVRNGFLRDADHERLSVAVGRIQAALDAGGIHG